EILVDDLRGLGTALRIAPRPSPMLRKNADDAGCRLLCRGRRRGIADPEIAEPKRLEVAGTRSEQYARDDIRAQRRLDACLQVLLDRVQSSRIRRRLSTPVKQVCPVDPWRRTCRLVE